MDIVSVLVIFGSLGIILWVKGITDKIDAYVDFVIDEKVKEAEKQAVKDRVTAKLKGTYVEPAPICVLDYHRIDRLSPAFRDDPPKEHIDKCTYCQNKFGDNHG